VIPKFILSAAVGVVFYFLMPKYLTDALSEAQQIGLSVAVSVVCFFLASPLYRLAGRPLSWPLNRGRTNQD